MGRGKGPATPNLRISPTETPTEADCGTPNFCGPFKRRRRSTPNHWRCDGRADVSAYYLGAFAVRFTRSGDIRFDSAIYFMARESNLWRENRMSCTFEQ